MIPAHSQPKPKKNSSQGEPVRSRSSFTRCWWRCLVYFAAREGYLGKKLQEDQRANGEGKAAGEAKGTAERATQGGTAESGGSATQGGGGASEWRPHHLRRVRRWWPHAGGGTAPSFEFGGGKAVNSESDPVQLYKGYVDHELRSHWDRPDNLPADDHYVAEVRK